MAQASGYQAALAQAGIAFDETLQHLNEPTASVGQAAVAKMLALAKPPTAILTGSVHITLGVIQFLEQAGIDTPGQLSLIGFGEAPWFEWWRGGLTTIRPPVKDLATSCGLWLLDNLRNTAPDTFGPYRATTNSLLVHRTSVRCLP